MENKRPKQTDIEKITILLPYWLNHNNDHIRDQEKWQKKAEKTGLVSVAEEVGMAIEHLKKANRHFAQAGRYINNRAAADSVEIIGTEKTCVPAEAEKTATKSMPVNFRQIGVIRTPYTNNAPYQPVADDEGEFRIIVNSQYRDALLELERFHYIYVLYYAHRVGKELSMKVNPSWAKDVTVGVFASRSPVRPNRLGLSVVRVKRIVDNQIITSGLDVFDQTPLVDIKPYIQALDSKSDANYGWMESLDDREHLMLHIKGIPHAY